MDEIFGRLIVRFCNGTQFTFDDCPKKYFDRVSGALAGSGVPTTFIDCGDGYMHFRNTDVYAAEFYPENPEDVEDAEDEAV